ncbi:hypothetical protein [Bradyrhizobium liaoningense]
MLSLKNQMAKNFRNEFLAQAEELKGNIQAAIEHSITGNLRDSVRVKDVSTDTKPSVLVIAGGSLTTKRTQAGVFDYSLAEEFGTVKQEAAPFFYPTGFAVNNPTPSATHRRSLSWRRLRRSNIPPS